MSRRLPTAAETARILGEKRTRAPRRPAPRLGRKLTGFIKELDAKFGATDGALHARWREIVGEALAVHTEPIKVIKSRTGGGGTLQLKVGGPIAALVQHQAGDILARANMVLGAGAVDKLRIVQGPVRAVSGALDAAAAVKARRRKQRPLDAAQEAQLDRGLEKVAEGPLKAALQKLGREVLRRQEAGKEP